VGDGEGGASPPGVAHPARTPSKSAAAVRAKPLRQRGQAPRVPRISSMWLIVLEALGALLILVFIVWWTMFSGRKKGERKDE
jgi:hypothetical protein